MLNKYILVPCAFVMNGQIAHAQDVPPPAAASATGGEIIVTAQHRAERQRDVPLSITTKSASQLAAAGITSIRDITMVTPGLKFDTGGAGFALPSIRGITTNVSGAGVEANVAIYVDGVYQTSQVATTFDLPDIERLEVDKGPQGTLFGRNATGGAIQVFTEQPSFTPSGNVTVGYGSFNDLLAKGFVTAPLVADKLAFSASGYYESNDGYLHDVLRDKRAGKLDSRLFRAKLLFTPTPDLKFTLSGQYMDRRDDSSPNGQALDGNTIANVPGSGALVPTKPYDVALSLPGYSRVKGEQISLKGEWDTDIGALTSISSYQHSRAVLRTDTDFSVSPVGDTIIHQPDTAYTEELTFASKKFGPLSFVGGLFYIWHEGQFDPLVAPGSLYLRKDFRTRSIAGFGEATLAITNRLSLIAGLRYTHEQVSFASSAGIGAPAALNPTTSQPFHSLTPRVSLRYALNNYSNIYYTYNRGFKSGGIDTTNYATNYEYKPEKVDAFEVGIKSRLADWLDVNLSGFYYDYRNQQQLGLVQACFADGAGGQSCAPTAIFLNASSSHIYGLDFDATTHFTREFSVTTGISALHARYVDFPNALIDQPLPGPPHGNVAEVIDASGNHLIRAPDFTLSLAATYRTEIAGGELALSGLLYHSSAIYYDFDERVRQRSYTTLNLRAEYTLPRTPITFAVYGKNLTNKAILQSTYINDNADGVSYAPPRTWGVSAAYKF